jgi:cell division protein FtsB
MKLTYHHLRHYATIQNGAVALALLIAVVWVWGTVVTLQRNFEFQRQVDSLDQEVELMKLENENLAFQKRYYKSDEFLELSARQRLGKASPGEHLVILPSSADIKDTAATKTPTKKAVEVSSFSQWMQFFFSQKGQG